MSVTLNPSGQLGFQRPLTQLVKRSLAVTNPNSSPIAFKVKTTAPKQYCVRPNSGRIEPGETVQVQVLLQPMKEDPAPGTKCRDKFLVQSVIITPDHDANSLTELWSSIEKEDKAAGTPSQIHEQKIRCTYLPAADDGSATGPNGGTFPIQEEEQPSKLDSVCSASDNNDASFVSSIAPTSPQAPSPPTATTPQNEGTPSFSSPQPNSVSDKAAEVASAATGAVTGAAAAVSSTVSSTLNKATSAVSSSSVPAPLDPSDKSLITELANAKAEIASLRKQLAAAETNAATLRSRGVAGEKGPVSGGESSTAQAVAHQNAAGGVPVQVVAGIAIGVFVFTWAFL